MNKNETAEEKTKGRQKKTYLFLILGIFAVALLFFYLIIPSKSIGKKKKKVLQGFLQWELTPKRPV